MSDPAAGQPADTGKQRPRGVGSVLRKAREKSEFSVADVANVLKLPERMILALEAERYDALPSRPYIRGYVGRYARVVGLEEAALTAAFDAADEAQTTPAIMPTPRRSSLAEFARRRWGLLYGSIVFVFILVIAGALWWAWSGVNAQQVAAEVDDAANTEQEPAPATPGDPVDAASSDEQTATGSTESAPAAEPGSGTPATTVPELVQDSAPADRRVATDAPLGQDGLGSTDEQPAAREAGPAERPDLLTFVFREDCWVEVHSKNGDLMHSDLGRGGETLTLTGEAPFSILVGYAAGVEITLNGDRVALGPGTRGEVAKLVVGH